MSSPDDVLLYFMIRGKAVADKIPVLLDLVRPSATGPPGNASRGWRVRNIQAHQPSAATLCRCARRPLARLEMLSPALWALTSRHINPLVMSYPVLQVRRCPAWICVSYVDGPSHPGTATPPLSPPLLDQVRDMVTDTKLDNQKRAVEMLKESKARKVGGWPAWKCSLPPLYRSHPGTTTSSLTPSRWAVDPSGNTSCMRKHSHIQAPQPLPAHPQGTHFARLGALLTTSPYLGPYLGPYLALSSPYLSLSRPPPGCTAHPHGGPHTRFSTPAPRRAPC